MTVNTYGRKLKGLRKASGATKNFGYYSGRYVEVFYDRSTGEVWTVEHYCLGWNEWTEYKDKAIIKICNTHRHLRMQDIADAINDRVAEVEYYEKYYGSFPDGYSKSLE